MTHDRTQWGAIAVLLIAGLFSAGQFGKYTLTLSELLPVYGNWSGFVVSAVGVIGIVFGAVAAGRVARFGLKKSLMVALIAGGALSVLQTVLPPLPLQIALRALEGFSHLAIVIAAPTLMASLSNNHDRPVVMGIWASFFGVALAILAVIIPHLLAHGGLQAVLWFHGAGIAMMAIAVQIWVPADVPSLSPRRSYIAEHLAIYGSARAVIAGAGFVFYTLLYIALIAVLPGPLNLSSAQVGILPLVSLTSTFGAGWLARRYAPPLITMSGFVGMVVCLVLLAIQPNVWTAGLVFLAAGLIPGACFASIPHFNTTPEDRARATGAIAQLGNVGTTCGTPIFVFALATGELTAVVTVAALFCIIGIVTVQTLWSRCR